MGVRRPIGRGLPHGLHRPWQLDGEPAPGGDAAGEGGEQGVVRDTEGHRETGERVDLSSKVDPDVLGGLVLQVGNMVLDASVRNRLERLRKQVAKAA